MRHTLVLAALVACAPLPAQRYPGVRAYMDSTRDFARANSLVYNPRQGG